MGFQITEKQTPGEEEHLEGLLVRKHEWESTTKRAQPRYDWHNFEMLATY